MGLILASARRRSGVQHVTRRMIVGIVAAIAAVVAPGLGQQSAGRSWSSMVQGERAVGADVITGDMIGNPISGAPPVSWGVQGGISAYSIGTTSCNIGTMPVQWIDNSNLHPVIGQNLFRFRMINGSGRFEQIGQSWVKHAFCATQGTLCTPCTPYGPGCEDHLGVGCSDPYASGGNGNQLWLGPKSQVNAATGTFAWPHPTPDTQCGTGGVCGRLQAAVADVDPAQNVGAIYFGEGQYVTQDDALAGNAANNASYRRVQFGGGPNYAIAFVSGHTIVRESPGIAAWATLESGVSLANIDVPDDGRLILGSRVTALGGGQWHFEYALQNLNSDRSADSFAVVLPAAVSAGNIGFHDVNYHSGDGFVIGTNFDGADWPAVIGSASVAWTVSATTPAENANALRWGTLYNFRFDADRPPRDGTITIGLYKAGSPASMSVVGPTPCPRGDFTGDSAVSAADIPPFVERLLGLTSIDACIADVNSDGLVNGDDIGPFVALLP